MRCRRRAAIEVIPYLAVILYLGLLDRDGMIELSFIRDEGLTKPVLVLAHLKTEHMAAPTKPVT
jgi:hypothetical protein